MASQTSHYKASTKAGFPAGELAGLLLKHGPNADYKVVISLRGKIRELIITEDDADTPVYDQDARCETPAPADHSSNWRRAQEGLPPAPADHQDERLRDNEGRLLADRGGRSFRRGY